MPRHSYLLPFGGDLPDEKLIFSENEKNTTIGTDNKALLNPLVFPLLNIPIHEKRPSFHRTLSLGSYRRRAGWGGGVSYLPYLLGGEKYPNGVVRVRLNTQVGWRTNRYQVSLYSGFTTECDGKQPGSGFRHMYCSLYHQPRSERSIIRFPSDPWYHRT